MDLENTMLYKKFARHRETNTIQFHLCEVLRISKFIKNRIEITRVGGIGERKMINGYRVLLGMLKSSGHI